MIMIERFCALFKKHAETVHIVLLSAMLKCIPESISDYRYTGFKSLTLKFAYLIELLSYRFLCFVMKVYLCLIRS